MRRLFIALLSTLLVIAIVGAIGISVLKIYADNNIDYSVDERLFESARMSSTATFMAYNEHGDLIEYYKGSRGGINKTWYDTEEISENLKLAFLAIEDTGFYSHKGIDLKRTVAALINEITHLRPSFGASTITQQVIKNISGDNEKTFKRKLNEILRALHLEMRYTKDEILEMYLNIIPLTGTICGVGEGAAVYFDKEPKELTVAEAATIAAITNSPVKYDPYTNADNCIERRNLILKRMLEEGFITNAEYSNSINSPLKLAEYSSGAEVCPWFIECAVDEIISDIIDKYSVSEQSAYLMLYSGTTTILTVNPRVQTLLERYFYNEFNLDPEVSSGLQYAFTINDAKTNNLVAVVGQGGKKTGNRLLNYATALNSPASALKPIALYAPSIDLGIADWSTMVDDAPIRYTNDEERVGYPKNSPDIYEGRITIADAIKKSKNTVAVKLYNALGQERIYSNLYNNYGFKTLVDGYKINGKTHSDKGPSALALGQLTLGISLRDLTSSYSVFLNDGVLKSSTTYLGVVDREGYPIVNSYSSEKRLMSSSTAQIMTQLLKGVVDDGTASSISLKYSVDVAGKTGTSSAGADRLFIGFTPYYLAGIWCGYGDNRAIAALKKSHLSVWNEVMTLIHESEALTKYSESELSFKSNQITQKLYCTESGLSATDDCVELGLVQTGYFDKSRDSLPYCALHQEIIGE